MLKFFRALALFVLIATPAYADTATDYIKPTWNDFIKILIEFKALDFKADDALVDEYAMMTNCDLYASTAGDEFRWRTARAGLLETIQKLGDNQLTKIRYDTPLQLTKYDFSNKLFPFTARTSIDNVNSFLMTTNNEFKCGRGQVQYLPHDFRAVTKNPITIPGIPMSPEDGETILRTMDMMKNTNRTIYTRFSMHVIDVQPLLRYTKHDKYGNETPYYLQGHSPPNPTQLDVVVDSVDFFVDPYMEVKIYSYKP